MRALIVGLTSCAGRHLAHELLTHGWDVGGTLRRGAPAEGAAAPAIPAAVRRFRLDAGDFDGTRALIDSERPQAVFVLASAPRAANLSDALHVAAGALAAVFHAMLALSLRPVVVFASSSAVYGTRSTARPLAESACLEPAGDYGLCKQLVEQVCLHHARRHEIPVRIARAFNHPGPGERAGLFGSDHARRIIAVERGLAPPVIEVMKPSSVRDFVDVRDVAGGYRLIAQCGRDGQVYNLCSGAGVTVREAVGLLAGHSTASVELTRGEDATAPDMQVGDPGKAERELGWIRRYPLTRTFADLLEQERKKA